MNDQDIINQLGLENATESIQDQSHQPGYFNRRA